MEELVDTMKTPEKGDKESLDDNSLLQKYIPFWTYTDMD